MQISVRTLQGETIRLEVQGTETIQNVKRKIQNQVRIRTDLQRLMFANQQLENNRSLTSYGIDNDSTLHLVLRSAESSKTVAGGYGSGNSNTEFCFPYGLAVDMDQTIYIADWGNHRITCWKKGEMDGRVIAGGHGQGKELNQLNCPTDILIDLQTDSLIIADHGNRRVIQWSRREGITHGQILIDNIACWGLALDNQRRLYVSDIEQHEVKRYDMQEDDANRVADGHGRGVNNETRVAGEHGRGVGFHQLNKPTYIFVDQQQNLYVSDTWNHRVMKWEQNATKGTIVVRGLARGLFVDPAETVYVADYGQHRLVRWPKGAKEGTVIEGVNRGGEDASELFYPWGLSFDQQGQIYVADHSYHRVQRFPI